MRFYTVFFPARIRCFACSYEGKSKVSSLYRVMGVLWLPFSTVTMSVVESARMLRGSWVALVIGPFVMLSIVFSKRAHRCPRCGSEFHSRI